jgi:hypothetical protein
MLGHYLLDEAEEGADLGGSTDENNQDYYGSDSDNNDDTAASDDGASADDDGEVIVTLGDEPIGEPDAEEKTAPSWVKDLRKAQRELQRENRELKAKLEQSAPKPKAPEVGKKPTLEDCDYDGDKFEQELTAWHDRKRQADQIARDQESAHEEQQRAWQERLNVYATAKTDLKAKDYDDAEATVLGSLNETQQGIVIQGADNPALVVYALGKNPKKAAELAAIKDHVKFAFAIAKLETQLKVQNRKAPPAPEKVPSGAGKISGTVDSHLERLREEAAKTGDMSKVVAYKRQQKEKARG